MRKTKQRWKKNRQNRLTKKQWMTIKEKERGTVIIQTCRVSIKNQTLNHSWAVEETGHVLGGTALERVLLYLWVCKKKKTSTMIRWDVFRSTDTLTSQKFVCCCCIYRAKTIFLRPAPIHLCFHEWMTQQWMYFTEVQSIEFKVQYSVLISTNNIYNRHRIV